MKTFYFALATLSVLALTQFFGGRTQLLAFLRKKETLNEIKKYVLAAEKYIIGTQKGQERLSLVCERLYDLIPKKLEKYVTREILVEAVNYVFRQLAENLENGHTVAVEREVK